MGAPMTRAGVLLFGKPSAATPLLGHVAGLHAERIARFWPAPHAGFLTLPAAAALAVSMSNSISSPRAASSSIAR